MPVAGSTYWNMVHGNTPEEVLQDLEGMRTMREELADLVCDGVIPMEEFLRTVEVR